jgi:hypothetical protein
MNGGRVFDVVERKFNAKDGIGAKVYNKLKKLGL